MPSSRSPRAVRRRRHPVLDDAAIKDLSLYQLRQALRANSITFPNPVPTFERHDRPDLQWRIAQLYFVSGWSSDNIARRFGILRQRVCQILNTWKRRAVEMGFIQCIPPADSIELPSHGIRAVISPVPGRGPSALPVFEMPDNTSEERRTPPNHRPRRKAELLQIVDVLRQLAAGRTAGELAIEAGVTKATVHDWKQKYAVVASDAEEMRKLRDENEHLKKMVADLSAAKEPLIHPIRKSYRLHA